MDLGKHFPVAYWRRIAVPKSYQTLHVDGFPNDTSFQKTVQLKLGDSEEPVDTRSTLARTRLHAGFDQYDC